METKASFFDVTKPAEDEEYGRQSQSKKRRATRLSGRRTADREEVEPRRGVRQRKKRRDYDDYNFDDYGYISEEDAASYDVVEPNAVRGRVRRTTTDQIVEDFIMDSKFYKPGRTKEVKLVRENSDRWVKIEDGTTATTPRGYSVARSSFPVINGAWYFEATVEKPIVVPLQDKRQKTSKLPEFALRCGWSTLKGDTEGPVGCDSYSYSCRSSGGVFHACEKIDYDIKYGVGDVVGFYIYLPKMDIEEVERAKQEIQMKLDEEEREKSKDGKVSSKKRKDVRIKNPGSKVVFYVNGQNKGVAFKDIYHGQYYPALSMYMGGSVKANFGPEFKYPPKDAGAYRPCCELNEQWKIYEKEDSPLKIKQPKGPLSSDIKMEDAVGGLGHSLDNTIKTENHQAVNNTSISSRVASGSNQPNNADLQVKKVDVTNILNPQRYIPP
eukprot:CAMPEP_0168534604 /NCGR_PEP_ID=MMETSP0405-20121227/18042_1 /TAXON_ID=498012 /ORGANISM="Trichosphaerium sp, Strain Am-I-7 wt" /LENGTH=438 /DNA_ID=CAMNT_0008561429 /DNA_START=254 /DNA_END=1567 /DNA_ORIENTATION=-